MRSQITEKMDFFLQPKGMLGITQYAGVIHFLAVEFSNLDPLLV